MLKYYIPGQDLYNASNIRFLQVKLYSSIGCFSDIAIIFPVKLELAKYYKDSEMTAFISERSRNSK